MRSTRARRTALIMATAALAACVHGAPSSGTRAPEPSTEGAARTAPDERPNLLMITVDDLAEGDLRFMPRTRRLLADQGTTLDEGLSPTPICAPSRASLLTGQYAHHHGVVTIEGPGGGFAAFDDRRTLPTWLRTAGYDTMFAGKYLNGYGVRNPRYVPPGWNRWRGSVDFSTYSFTRTQFNVDGRVVQPRGYSTDLLGRYTTELLREHRTSAVRGRPWFLWVNYVAPHHGGPRASDDPAGIQTTTPAPRHVDDFRHLDLPRDPALWEQDVRGNPYAGERPSSRVRAAVREAYQQRIESVQAVDEAVGRTVADLRRHGELSRTVIVLASDNGFLTGQHNKFGKLVAYDGSVRIPMVVRGPGVPRGRHLTTPVTTADLAVTFAGLAGARPTRRVDGVDVWPWLREPSQVRPVPLEAYPVSNGRHRLYSGIRYADYTYVRSRSGFEELYDRSADPGELVNVARRAAYRPVLRQLRDWERRYRDCAGTGCPQTFEPTPRVRPTA